MYPSETPLGSIIPKLDLIPEAEDLTKLLLCVDPEKRVKANKAMRHKFFDELPTRIHELHEIAPIFNIPGLKLASEEEEEEEEKKEQVEEEEEPKTKERSKIKTTLKV